MVSIKLRGLTSFLLDSKLEFLTFEIRKWNRWVFGKINLRIERLLEEIKKLDEKAIRTSLPFDERILKFLFK